MTEPPTVSSFWQYACGESAQTLLQQYRRHTPVATAASLVAAGLSTTQSNPGMQSLDAAHDHPLPPVPAALHVAATALAPPSPGTDVT
jgi:hypothetical protein